MEKDVIHVSEAIRPQVIKVFEDLLWANSPRDWTIRSVYFNNTLFLSMFINKVDSKQLQKVRRSFSIDIIQSRQTDLWGMASDCIDEMKRELLS